MSSNVLIDIRHTEVLYALCNLQEPRLGISECIATMRSAKMLWNHCSCPPGSGEGALPSKLLNHHREKTKFHFLLPTASIVLSVPQGVVHSKLFCFIRHPQS